MKSLDRPPIMGRSSSLGFGARFTTVHRDQILVWVRVDSAGTLRAPENLPSFPALLDTGNNFDFSVQDRQLREWGGIEPDSLAVLGHVAINGQFVMRREATVWLYSNVPGKLEPALGVKPFPLRMTRPGGRCSPHGSSVTKKSASST